MPDFQPHILDLVACRQEVQEFKTLLEGSSSLSEKVLRRHFESHAHLRALIGFYDPSLAYPDLSFRLDRFMLASQPLAPDSADRS